MIDGKVGDRVADAGVLERVPSPSGGRGVPGVVQVDAGRIVMDACRRFARAVDWQHDSSVKSGDGDSRLEGLRTGHLLSENHEGLHSGMYINVSVLQAANTLVVKGGCYDRYWQPKTVYKESVPLMGVTTAALGHLLMGMHDRLGRCSAGEAT